MALDPAIVAEITSLLAKHDESQRAIARITGASRGTVNAIATGKRGVASASKVFVDGPLARCPGCGDLARIPPKTGDCLACQIRLQGGKATKRGGDESMALALDPEHRKRYEAMRSAAKRRWSAGSPVDKPPDPR